MTTTQASTIRVCMHPEQATHSLMDPCRTWPCPQMTGQLSGNDSLSFPGGNSSPSFTTKNGKPTSTNGAGSGSGAQPTGIAQSPGFANSRSATRPSCVVTRASCSISETRAIHDVFYHSRSCAGLPSLRFIFPPTASIQYMMLLTSLIY